MADAVPVTGEGGRSGPRSRLVEVLVFLFLIVPSMFLSLFLLQSGELPGFTFLAVSTILRDLGLVSLVLFFVWRNGEPWAVLGWKPGNGLKEAVLGAGLFIPVFLGALLIENILESLGLAVPGTPSALQARGAAQAVLAFILVTVVAVAEETIFRGYLLLRFREAALSPVAAVVLAAAIFSLGHGYEGLAGVVAVAYLGVAFGVVYLWRGSLVAPMVMHFLQDFLGVIIAPLLGLK